MYRNGDSIPYLLKLAESGRETALDSKPQLDIVQVELWNLYCYTTDNMLQGLAIYQDRIGLPTGWDFEDSLTLVNTLSSKRIELEKAKHD